MLWTWGGKGWLSKSQYSLESLLLSAGDFLWEFPPPHVLGGCPWVCVPQSSSSYQEVEVIQEIKQENASHACHFWRKQIQLRSTTAPPKHAADADVHIFYMENSKLIELATEI